MVTQRSWTSVCTAIVALLLFSVQGINSQSAEISTAYTAEHTTDTAQESYTQTDLIDDSIRESRTQNKTSLDDVTISDDVTEVQPLIKVVTKKETKIPESASRLIVPISNFTIRNNLLRTVKTTSTPPPIPTPVKHVVERLGNDEFNNAKIVQPKINKNEIKPHKQYDEVTGELKSEEHPCKRECKEGESMICFYHFNLEHYQTMSKACYLCPYNSEDCNRPDCIPADGMNRAITVVNRKMPGPAIEVCEGDRIIVDVENDLMTEGTTVHWHGQHQKRTPYMDGTPYVTQCPILPETTFRYQFNATTPGTHFWHSHSGMQRADGAAGSLIIRKPKSQEPHARLYDYDRSDHVMIVTDWIHDLSVGMFTHHHHSWGDNKPPTLLINGVGRFNVFDNATHTTKPIYMKAATFNVEQGFRYRFRVINAEFLNCPIEMSVDGHNITIIASDGFDLEPITATSLVTYAGERFDFILETNNEIDNYWIRFRGLMDCDERFTKAKQVAVLHYEGAMEAEPSGDPTWEELHNEGLQLNALNKGEEDEETISVADMRSLEGYDESLKETADYQFYVAYDFYPKNNSHFHRSPYYGYYQVPDQANRLYTPQLNHISMKMPSSPLLIARPSSDAFCNSSSIEKSCKEDYCECSHVLSVRLNSIVEVVIVDEGVTFDANHPFHLHGHNFRVVGMRRLANQTTIEQVKAFDEAGFMKRNLKNAPLKDTITVPDGGYTVIRFKADNPGYWLFHCHIEFHVEVGMALVFKVGEHKDMRPVPRDFPTCGSYLPDNNLEDETTAMSVGDQFIQITHWWPVVVVNTTSSAVRSSCFSSILTLCSIWLLKFGIGT